MTQILRVCLILIVGQLLKSFGNAEVITDAPALSSIPHLFWSIPGGIVGANIDGTGVSPIVSWGGPINKMDVDPRFGTLYWTHMGGVSRWDPSNNTTTQIFTFAAQHSGQGLAIDDVRDHLYFVERESSTIHRTDLNGANPHIIVPTDGLISGIHRISSLRVDPKDEKLYWTHGFSFWRSNLDGSNIEELFSSGDFISSFDIDSLSGKIYWNRFGSGRGAGSVNRANLDGSDFEMLVSDLWNAGGLELDLQAGKMYISDFWSSGPTDYDGTIRIANLDGTDAQVIVNTGPRYGPGPIAIRRTLVPEPQSMKLLIVLGVGLVTRRCPLIKKVA